MARFLPIVYQNNFLGRDASAIWHVQDKWTGRRGVYSGFVESKSDFATKKDLARLITGNEDDWTTLGVRTKNVKAGQRISIAPLLAILENKLRQEDVQIAAGGRLNTRFSEPLYNSDGFEITNFATITVSEGSQADVINSYFGNTPYQEADCDYAIRLVFSKAILETIGKAAYDATGQYIGSIPTINVNSKSMLIGDRGWLQNYTDYKKKYEDYSFKTTQKISQGYWQAENVIKVTSNLYWGFTGDNLIRTSKEWEAHLREAYNKPGGQTFGRQRQDPLPGFTGGFDFIDVGAIALPVFLYQTTEMEQ